MHLGEFERKFTPVGKFILCSSQWNTLPLKCLILPNVCANTWFCSRSWCCGQFLFISILYLEESVWQFHKGSQKIKRGGEPRERAESTDHRRWSVPKSQFIHLRQNCTINDDYIGQVITLETRFVDKGYKEEELDKLILNVGNLCRDTILRGVSNIKNAIRDWNVSFVKTYKCRDIGKCWRMIDYLDPRSQISLKLLFMGEYH